MKNFYERTEAERNIIRKAYEFEIEAIENLDPMVDSPANPYMKDIKAMGLWKAFNEAVSMAYGH